MHRFLAGFHCVRISCWNPNLVFNYFEFAILCSIYFIWIFSWFAKTFILLTHSHINIVKWLGKQNTRVWHLTEEKSDGSETYRRCPLPLHNLDRLKIGPNSLYWICADQWCRRLDLCWSWAQIVNFFLKNCSTWKFLWNFAIFFMAPVDIAQIIGIDFKTAQIVRGEGAPTCSLEVMTFRVAGKKRQKYRSKRPHTHTSTFALISCVCECVCHFFHLFHWRVY